MYVYVYLYLYMFFRLFIDRELEIYKQVKATFCNSINNNNTNTSTAGMGSSVLNSSVGKQMQDMISMFIKN